MSIKQNDIQRRDELQNICLYKTGKAAVPGRIISSGIQWHRVYQEDLTSSVVMKRQYRLYNVRLYGLKKDIFFRGCL